MLTPEQRSEIARQGIVRLPGAFAGSTARAMADRVWSYLEEHRGILRDGTSWNVPGPWVGLKTLKDEELFQTLHSPVLTRALNDLLGEGNWKKPRHWGGFLVTFPDCRPEEWTIPAKGWHVDGHFTHEPDSTFSIRVFTFLSEVGPRGGGTLVVKGSHRLVRRYIRAMTPEQRQEGYSILRDRFNVSDPWLKDLTSGDQNPGRTLRFTAEHEIDGVAVRVEPLCGSPGDVILAHPWFLHATAPNSGPGPRFMLAKDIDSVGHREALSTA